MNYLKKINYRTAINIILIISIAVIFFHSLILMNIIPYQYVWGGRIESDKQMQVFETVSILINLFIIFIVATKGGYIKNYLSPGVVKVFLWIFFILFTLNTVGNLFSSTTLEAIIFTPITLILAILFYRIITDEYPLNKPKEV